MRTTLDIEEDVLAAAKEIASRQKVSAGAVVSRLMREALSGHRDGKGPASEAPRSVAGFQPFPAQGVVITNAHIDALRDAEGI